MKRVSTLIAAVWMLAVAGCADIPQQSAPPVVKSAPVIVPEPVVQRPAPVQRAANPNAVSEALLPPLVVEMPRSDIAPPDTRFDLNVNNAPANQVFMAIVSGTRYSMVVHPSVKEPISVNLKDVTVPEALDTLRDLYGYDYRIQGNRILVQPVSLQSRVFQVNYLQGMRRGQTEMRFPATSESAAGGGAEGSRMTTAAAVDFWGDLHRSITGIIGTADGRSVTANPQSGVIVVRAMPSELRSVQSFLQAMQLIVDRQLMLEARIVEVRLAEGNDAGVNWSRLGLPLPGAAGSGPGAIYGLALPTGDFAGLLAFLETQGSVQILSSPRVATLNNQKSVLKVGTDEFFVTNLTANAANAAAAPTISVQPFFSGVVLDVTPQIDDAGNVVLHVHPSVSNVVEKRKVVDLGRLGTFTLPVASSEVNEADTVVRVPDNHIVAISGLMRETATGAVNSGTARARTGGKTELVILIKPTIVAADPRAGTAAR